MLFKFLGNWHKRRIGIREKLLLLRQTLRVLHWLAKFSLQFSWAYKIPNIRVATVLSVASMVSSILIQILLFLTVLRMMMVNENGVFVDNIEILFAKVTAADVPRVICGNACRGNVSGVAMGRIKNTHLGDVKSGV